MRSDFRHLSIHASLTVAPLPESNTRNLEHWEFEADDRTGSFHDLQGKIWTGWMLGVEIAQTFSSGGDFSPAGNRVTAQFEKAPLGDTWGRSHPNLHPTVVDSSCPNDLVGSRTLPHLAAFVSRMWLLPTDYVSLYGGGWHRLPFRPPSELEEWPRLGAKGLRMMDPKQRSQGWDRRGPRDQQVTPPWGRNRNLSWRLRPPLGRGGPKVILPGSSTSGEIESAGIPNPIAPSSLTEIDSGRKLFCQKCGDEGHHARDCSKNLWCEICRKDTHVTAKCVWPKQTKPTMPIVGMAADGLGFYMMQFAKSQLNKPKPNALGLVKVLEGGVSAEELVKDFDFHFPWGRVWKATKCQVGYIMQFPSQERLDEMVQFPELKMKMSGVKISVVPWISSAITKARLHTIWVVAENVPEELRNFQAICELGSALGAVEEVDLKALEMQNCVRFKVHVKSISMIPPVLEVGVKPYLFDIFFKIDGVEEEGWNEESGNLGKRASVDTQHRGWWVKGKMGKR